MSTCKNLAHALGVHELEMLTAAGHVTDRLEPSDDELLEPELRVFFREVWSRMSENEQEIVMDYVGMVRIRVERKGRPASVARLGR